MAHSVLRKVDREELDSALAVQAKLAAEVEDHKRLLQVASDRAQADSEAVSDAIKGVERRMDTQRAAYLR